MKLVITDDVGGEEKGVLTEIEGYDLGSEIGAALVVAWIDETIRGDGNDG